MNVTQLGTTMAWPHCESPCCSGPASGAPWGSCAHPSMGRETFSGEGVSEIHHLCLSVIHQGASGLGFDCTPNPPSSTSKMVQCSLGRAAQMPPKASGI